MVALELENRCRPNQMKPERADLKVGQLRAGERVEQGQQRMTVDERALVLRSAQLHVEQPFWQAVVFEMEAVVVGLREEVLDLGQQFLDMVQLDIDVDVKNCGENLPVRERFHRRQDDIEDVLEDDEVLIVGEERLEDPQIETAEDTRYVLDDLDVEIVVDDTVEDDLEVHDVSVALDMQQIQQFRCFRVDDFLQIVVLVDSIEDVQLNVADDIAFRQIVDVEFPEAHEFPDDHFILLSTGAHKRQPFWKEIVVRR